MRRPQFCGPKSGPDDSRLFNDMFDLVLILMSLTLSMNSSKAYF